MPAVCRLAKDRELATGMAVFRYRCVRIALITADSLDRLFIRSAADCQIGTLPVTFLGRLLSCLNRPVL